MPSSKLQPALLGGLVMGVLSGLPIIGIGNMCCCLWVISGGVVAAYLLQSGTPVPITTVDGAVVGLLAGVIGAVVDTLISVPVAFLMGPFQARVLQRLMDSVPDVPAAARTALENPGAGVVGTIVNLIVMLFVGVIFGTIGGVIGAAIFGKKNLTPATTEPPAM